MRYFVSNSIFAIILMEKRELVALLCLSPWCLVIVLRLFLAVPRVCLQFVIVVFPDHTHLFAKLVMVNYFAITRVSKEILIGAGAACIFNFHALPNIIRDITTAFERIYIFFAFVTTSLTGAQVSSLHLLQTHNSYSLILLVCWFQCNRLVNIVEIFPCFTAATIGFFFQFYALELRSSALD